MGGMTGGARRLQTAEVIAIGSELLGSTRLDTNSLVLAERLGSLGIELRSKTVVGDNRREVAEHLRRALERADLVILTGGLGPTDDDVTRDALADVVGLPLIEQADIVERLVQRFARRGLKMPDVNRRQGLVIQGGIVLENPNGTAPGQMVDVGDRLVVLLPGPPRELRPMIDALVSGPLAARAGPERLYRTTLFTVGRGESHVEELAQPIYARWLQATPPIETTILAAPGQIELHFVTRSADAAAAGRALAAARDEILAALGPDVFSTDGRSMEEIVGQLLLDRQLTISAAESCTGGLLLSRLTDIPGSSAYVLGGVVTYSNSLKVELAGVPAALIEAHGAVSEPVAAALAEGVRSRTGATVGVGITGIAGPSGGTPQKPVGTVAVAVAFDGRSTRVRTFSLVGSRSMVKFQASQVGLDMVRRILLETPARK
jgi:competence/damage-inducible protein CinA-like protein